MSKIAKKTIDLTGVQYNYENNILQLSIGSKTFSVNINPKVSISIENNLLTTTSGKNDLSLCGTLNRIINNTILGLKSPFKQNVKLEGTGYKGALQGKVLTFQLGYSHPVIVQVPEDIDVKFLNPTQIEVMSINKESVGNFVNKLTKLRPHNPYTGKGVLKVGKQYIRKETKRK